METPGSLIDKLIIVNLKIFKAEDIKRDPEATDKDLADATRLTNKLNQHRNSLMIEIDELSGIKNLNSIKTYGK
jgi:hypothetical protein